MNPFGRYLSAAALALMLLVSVGCSATRTQESAGEYIDDVAITAQVKAAILEDAEVKATEVNVETFKGAVQLSGFVSSQAAANKAVALARGIKGVTSVKNNMEIK